MTTTCPRCKGRKSPAAKLCRTCSNKREFDGRYYHWRQTVLTGDHFSCQACLHKDTSGRTLEAHHIYPWRKHKHLRYDPENGIALCKSHHAEFHQLYGAYNNTWPQMEEFLRGYELRREAVLRSNP